MFSGKVFKTTIMMVIIAGLFCGLLPHFAEAANTRHIQLLSPDTYFVLDDSQSAKGYVTILATNETDETYKVLVSKDDKRYTYDFSGLEKAYPLQMGDGNYSIGVYQHLGQNQYIALQQWRINVKTLNKEEIYLIRHAMLFWDENGAAVEKARQLVRGLKNDQEKATAIYNYIVAKGQYDYKVASNLKAGYIPNVDQVFVNKTGICYDFSALYAAMLRSVDIPAKLVMGTTANVKGYHSWNEVLLSGKWVIVDTSYDIQAKSAKAKYGMIKTNEYKVEKEF